MQETYSVKGRTDGGRSLIHLLITCDSSYLPFIRQQLFSLSSSLLLDINVLETRRGFITQSSVSSFVSPMEY